jgi:pyridoxal phosphate enzyme (YggS family)
MMSDISRNLTEVLKRIDSACLRAGRQSSEVQLIAVSKTFPAEAVRDVVDAGHLHLGESRWQEAEPKIALLPGFLHWHFIGRVQRNKLRKILPCFDVIHAVDSLSMASAVNELAKELGLFPKVFLQVNVGEEASKGGFEPVALRAEMDRLFALERLEILGLMCIPPATAESELARPWFVMLRDLRDVLVRESGVPLPFLSMGMSEDFEVAIEEGATHVRVGSAIFGKRAYRMDGELG